MNLTYHLNNSGYKNMTVLYKKSHENENSMDNGNCEIQTTELQHLLWHMFYFPPNCDP